MQFLSVKSKTCVIKFPVKEKMKNVVDGSEIFDVAMKHDKGKHYDQVERLNGKFIDFRR